MHTLAQHLRTLLSSLETSVRRYATRHHYDAGTVSRFLSSERLPPEEFIDTLEREAAAHRGHAVTGQAQERAHKLYLAALRARNKGEYERQITADLLRESEQRLQQAEIATQVLREAVASTGQRHDPAELDTVTRQLAEALAERDEALARARQLEQQQDALEGPKTSGALTAVEHVDGVLPHDSASRSPTARDAREQKGRWPSTVPRRAIEAILLVQGHGMRLRPLTITTTLPMFEIGGAPVVLHQLAMARQANVHRLIVSSPYRPEILSDYFGDGSGLGLELVYMTQTEPLGSADAIGAAARQLMSGPDEPVLVFPSGVLSDVDLTFLLGEYEVHRPDAVMYLLPTGNEQAAARFNLVRTDPAGWVTPHSRPLGFLGGNAIGQINAGYYVFRKSVIDSIPSYPHQSLEREILPGLLAAHAGVRAVVREHYWLPLSTPDDLVRASADLVLGAVSSPATPATTMPQYPQALILDGTRVHTSADVEAGTVLGRDCVVGADARISASVIGQGCRIGNGTRIHRSIIGARTNVDTRCVLDGVVIGADANIGADNALQRGVRIWNDKTLAPGTVRTFDSDLF